MSLKVLYLTNIPSPYRVSFFNELGRYCDLTVIFEQFQSTERKDGWHDYNFKTFKTVFLKGFKVGLNKTIDFNISNFLSNQKFDIIVVSNYSTPNGIFSINYLNIKKIPFIISVDGGLIDYKESRIKYLFKKKLISSADGWLSTGKFTNQYLSYYGADKDKIYIYPFTTMKSDNIINQPLTINDKLKFRSELGIPYENVIISVGRSIPSKGFDVLIEAASHFKDNTGIYIIGGQPSTEYLELIKQLKINNVHFIDFLEYKKLKKYYLSADVFVLPTRGDVWGLVVNEAMANGLPVVTTTSCVAGIEMIENGINGYLIPKDNIKQLVEKTNRILENRALKEEMSKNNLLRSSEYTIENMAKITLEVIKNYVYKRQSLH